MISALLAAAVFSLTDVPAFSAEIAPEGVRLVDTSAGQPKELGYVRLGPLVDLLRHGDALYAAPAAGGLVVIDAQVPTAPVVTARLLDGQLVARIGHLGERFLFLSLDDRSAIAFSVEDPLHPVEAHFAPPEHAARGRVVGVHRGVVTIEGGTSVGFRVGDHVKLLPLGELGSGTGEDPTRPLAIVALTRVDDTQSTALLGRGDTAEVGSVVEETGEDTSGAIVGPHTPPFHWRLAATARPFVALNDSTTTAGALMDGRVDYYFSNLPLRLEAGLAPLGLVVGGTEQHNPAIAFLDVAFSTTYFEFGLGAGFSSLANSSACTALAPCSGAQQLDAVAPVLVFRFGALDGLNLTGTYAPAWSGSRFDASRAIEAAVNIPLARRLTLYLEGGGGTGFDYGEVGMRTYLFGLGGPGTLILSGGVGGAAITDGISEEPGGVAVSLGIETRL